MRAYMRACARTAFVAAVLSWPLLVSAATPAAAQECHATALKAAGRPSLLLRMAKSQARTSWMRKVRRKPTLGVPYAAWLRSKDGTFACRRDGRRHVCIARAVPCKMV